MNSDSEEVSSLDGHLSHALSIESLTKVPVNLRIAISKAKPNASSSNSRAQPVVKISSNQREAYINSPIGSIKGPETDNYPANNQLKASRSGS